MQSPGTRAVDLTLKRGVLEEAGVPSYWLVEPDDLLRPFPVRVVPERLSR